MLRYYLDPESWYEIGRFNSGDQYDELWNLHPEQPGEVIIWDKK
jgi:hypothetical protein